MGGERLDTRNPTSKLMLTILAGVATWEREIMLERQREGIAAKAAGEVQGPPVHHQSRRRSGSWQRPWARRRSPSSSGSPGAASTGCSGSEPACGLGYR